MVLALTAVTLSGCSRTLAADDTPSAVEEAQRAALVSAATDLLRNLRAYKATEDTYPLVSADDVQVVTQTMLTAPISVRDYEATADDAWFCLVNDESGGWVSAEATTNVLRTTGNMCERLGAP